MKWSRRPGARAGEAQRFWAKVTQDGDCWRWTGAHVSKGYGSFHLDDGGVVGAHRWAYEALIAPVPDGLELDHLCFVRDCVNPWHLDPVTHEVNVNRGRTNQNHGITECRYGHPFDDQNTAHYVRDGKPRRSCRACSRARTAAYRASKGAAA
jgi:hypothetical protein